LKQVSAFRINLNNIEGSGDFPCPSCGVIISPDDDSEKTYRIIILEGFEALNILDG